MAQESLQPYYMIMLQQDSSATQLLVVHATGNGVLHSRSNAVVCVSVGCTANSIIAKQLLSIFSRQILS